jgi:hypothetical protein
MGFIALCWCEGTARDSGGVVAVDQEEYQCEKEENAEYDTCFALSQGGMG